MSVFITRLHPIDTKLLLAAPLLVRELSSHRLSNVPSNWSHHSNDNSRSSASFRRGRFEVKEVEDHASNPALSSSRSRPQSPSPRNSAPVSETRGPLMLLVSNHMFCRRDDDIDNHH